MACSTVLRRIRNPSLRVLSPMVHGIDDHADLAFLDIIQEVRTVLANLGCRFHGHALGCGGSFAVPSVAAIV